MDNCTAHQSETIQELLDNNFILVHNIPPHCSDQCQPLDLCLFHSFKRKCSSLTIVEATDTTQELKRILDSWFALNSPGLVMASWEAMGLVLEWDGTNKLALKRGLAKKVRHWIDQSFDVSETQLQKPQNIKIENLYD